MTNDEIIKTVVSPDHALLYPQFERAMDAAREDEAVGFAEWKDKYFVFTFPLDGKYYKLRVYEFVKLIPGVLYGEHYNMTQLYQLYLKHKNEKK